MTGILLVEEVKRTDKGVVITGRSVAGECASEAVAAFKVAEAARAKFETDYDSGINSSEEQDTLDTHATFDTQVQPLLDKYHALIGGNVHPRLCFEFNGPNHIWHPGQLYYRS